MFGKLHYLSPLLPHGRDVIAGGGVLIASSRHRSTRAPHRCTPVSTRSARLCVGTDQSTPPMRVVDRGDVCVVRRWWMLRGRLYTQYGGGSQRQRGSGDSTRDFVESLHGRRAAGRQQGVLLRLLQGRCPESDWLTGSLWQKRAVCVRRLSAPLLPQN